MKDKSFCEGLVAANNIFILFFHYNETLLILFRVISPLKIIVFKFLLQIGMLYS